VRHWWMTSVPVKHRSQRSKLQRVRPRRDFAAMEARRMQAADLFEQGVTPARLRDGWAYGIRSSRIGAMPGDGLVEMGTPTMYGLFSASPR
jgi:hypothetical protein